MIRGLHHNAYRCRDSEQTRRFYEDFLGLPLAGAFPIRQTKTGRATEVLHSFYRLGDGSFLAFFEAPDQPFEFKPQHDFDLHIALAVDEPALGAMLLLAQQAGIEVRGISDHGFIRSIYLRDPNGYVIELAAPVEGGAAALDGRTARAELRRWQAARGR
ncbi:VOC family protein [Piscinibacter defluvii]|uniref:VOC family protein n=1 Tax=Piscinibacter defluvii TaxID=1796922 RepID=UPI000FDEB6A4|nr:VOC family protein [Piscinibacter defluvii]